MADVAQEAETRSDRRSWQGTRSATARTATVVPGALIVVGLFVVPLAVFAYYSVLTAGLYSVRAPITFDAYIAAFASSANRNLALNSLIVGLGTAVVTTLVGLPIAYYLRVAAGRWRVPVLFLITASMFASYLVRIYAWRSILGSNGLVNRTLTRFRFIDEPLTFLLYSRLAVVIALIHIFLPYVVLVLYAGTAPLGRGLIEAARDLGAGATRLWTKLIVPVMAAPVMTAFLFVFVLSAADYVTPQLLGGTGGSTLGVQIQANFITVGNWPLAAATSFLMLGVFVLCYLVSMGLLRWLRLDNLRFEST